MEQTPNTDAPQSNQFAVIFKRPLVSFVLVPLLVFAFYQAFMASDRFVSHAKIIVKEQDSAATLDSSLALLSGFGVSTGSSDTDLVRSYIYSNDMLVHLDEKLDIVAHYASSDYDIFSRLDSEPSREDLLSYYEDYVSVVIDDKSQVIEVSVQAFEPEFAQLMTQTIVERAEWFINEISRDLAKKQLEFVQREHQVVDDRLSDIKAKLLAFQSRHNLLDPQVEGMAFQQIAYTLEAEIAAKRTQLRLLRSSMSDTAPMVIQAKSELESLEDQLQSERARLTQQGGSTAALPDDEKNLGIGELLAKFGEYKIDLELALQAYASSQVSLEKSRIEAYRQIKYLVTVESPTLPEEAEHPERIYNISLFFVVNLLLFGVARILIATVKELRR
ncbi:lipopolysaccharide biosynthesis protein [Alteromonas sediminis]|uniref:Lipopolysaccharide biosynthesis protein n=2 Tax=Alteromonas sediminis TaxID=2259342 RepID=A0A3N5ZAV1_9ALTE|nr:lipopolysaccharide biosynthesis protein [Alteromonas sediminis]